MAEGSDHTQPSGTSREQILRDLEAAGLLRLLDAKPDLRRAAAQRSANGVPPHADRPWPHGQARRRRLILALCGGLAVAMIALACLLLLSMDGGM